jgi:hypothetical protein
MGGRVFPVKPRLTVSAVKSWRSEADTAEIREFTLSIPIGL